MKHLLLTATIALLPALAVADGQQVSLRLEVRQQSSVDNKGPQNATKTQHRQLEISVSNISRDPVEKVQVNWWFFSRNMKSGDESVLKKGVSKPFAVPALGKTTVSSDKVTSTYEERHTETVKSKGKGKGKPKTTVKNVPASGNKISGYAVKVVHDGEVVSEYYSAPSYKQRLAQAK